jgi:CopG antitoxin of type II toxin-antitoxin system
MIPKIPKTDSIQELATFWQRHDLTDFDDELEEMPGPVFQRAHVVGVPLSEDEHQAVRDAAASRGIDEAALIHEWVKERLHHA